MLKFLHCPSVQLLRVSASGARHATLGSATHNSSSRRILFRRASVKLSSSHQQDSQTFKLSNGHRVGYSACGPHSSPTIFFLHGYPGSRIEGLLLSEMSEKAGARIICPDRPGIGLSTFDPNRKLLDYPSHISQLASHLGLRSYRVVGGSGGAPYALACAKVLPRSQLEGVGVLAGMGPVELGLDGMRLTNRALISLITWMPGLTKWILDITFLRTIKDVDEESFRRVMDKQLKFLKPADREMFSKNPEIIKDMIRVAREHFRQGSMASVKEVQLLMQPWGFKLEDIDYENIQLWYGTSDANTPVQMGRKMASRLKNARLKEYSGATHFSLMDVHGEEIFNDMLNG